MRWFKHLTGSLKDPMISDAITEFGGDGYLVFFGILDMMAEDFDENNPGICTFSCQYLTRNLQLSRQKLIRILSFFEKYPKENGRISYTINGNKITLKCNRLKELSDNWTQRITRKSLRSNSEVTTAQEVEVEVEVEEDNKEESKYSLVPPSEKPKAKRRKIFFSDEDMRLSKLLDSLMLQNNPNRREPTEAILNSWANEFRLMREQDKRTVSEIEVVLRWSQTDNFWKSNIESAGKLRDKYDQLSLKMKERGLIEQPKTIVLVEYKGVKMSPKDRSELIQKEKVNG